MWKWFKYALGAFLLIAALLIYRGWASDIPHDTLSAKYATGASDFLDLPSGARAHFRMQGNLDGKTIVLLHGSNASLHTWEPWIAELSDQFLIVTVDLPGHGLTGAVPSGDYSYAGMVAFLGEFVDALDLPRFVLGGNSMGGGVTLAFAQARPERLTHLILVDAAGTRMPAEGLEKIDRPLAFDLAGRWYTDWIFENVTPRGLVEEGLLKSVSVKSIVTEEMVDQYWELVRHPGNRQATAQRFASYRQSGTGDMPVEDIGLSSLIIWGDEDGLIPVEAGYAMDARMPNSELKVFEGIGHLPMEELPTETAAAVRSFLLEAP